jgi:hypothetical protein
MFIAQLVLHGYTICVFLPKPKTYQRRLRRRGLKMNDPRILKQIDRGQKLIQRGLADVVIRMDEQITEFSGSPFTGIGTRGVKYDTKEYIVTKVMEALHLMGKPYKLHHNMQTGMNAFEPIIFPSFELYFYNTSRILKGIFQDTLFGDVRILHRHDIEFLTRFMDYSIIPLNSMIAISLFGFHLEKEYVTGLVNDRLESRSSPNFRGWYVAVPNPIPYGDTDIWCLAQTVPDARGMANVIRNQTPIRDTFYKDIRRLALKSYCQYHGYKYTLINHHSLIGVIHYGITDIPISVSGHLTNMLISNYFHVIDWKRYLNTIEWNMNNYLGNVSAATRLLHSEGILSERTSSYRS